MRPLRALVRWFVRLMHYICLPVLALLCLVARLFPGRFDVGIGPQPIINSIYWVQALRLKGYTAQTFVDKTFHITHAFDVNFSIGWRRIFYFLPGLSFLRCCFLYRCLYVYFDGGPLRHVPGLRLLEPKLLHLAGVKTVVMPYGSDSQIFERTPNKHMANVFCLDYPRHFQKDHAKTIRQVDVWSRGADIVIAAMDSIDYLFFWNRVRHCHFAFDTGAIAPHYPSPKPGETIKIIHAPNHMNIKGSYAVIAAVEQLQKEGYNVELELVRGKSNTEVLALLQTAHIAVDQLIMGTYAMFAIEAMANGKPVVGYLREDHIRLYEDLGCIEKGEAPTIQARTADVAEVLRGLLDAPETLEALGRKARAYVEKYHSLEAVGSFYDEINRAVGLVPRACP